MHTPLSAVIRISPAAPLFDYLRLHEAAKLGTTCSGYNVLLQGNLSLKPRLDLAQAEFKPLRETAQKINELLDLSYQEKKREREISSSDVYGDPSLGWEFSFEVASDLYFVGISIAYGGNNNVVKSKEVISQIRTHICTESTIEINKELLAENTTFTALGKNTMYAGADFAAAHKCIENLTEALKTDSDSSDDLTPFDKARALLDLKTGLRKHRCGLPESK